MEKAEAVALTKAISSLDRTLSNQVKEISNLARKFDVLNDSLIKLNDKIGTYIQLQQHS